MSNLAHAKTLIEARAGAWEEAKSLLDAVETEKRELSADESAQFDRITADLDDKDKRIAQIVDAEERAAKADEVRARFEGIVRPDIEARTDAPDETAELRSVLSGQKPSHEFRALSMSSAVGGGNTVPQGFYETLLQLTRENTAVLAMGPTEILVDNLNDFPVPTVTAFGTTPGVAEAAVIAGADSAFGQAVLKPSRKFGSITKVSFELANSTGVDLMGFIANSTAQTAANQFGASALTSASNPTGIMLAASVGVTAAASALTVDNLIDLMHSVTSADRANGVFLCRDSTLAFARKLKDSQGQYLWQPAVVAGQPDLLLGKAVFADPAIAAIATAQRSVAFLNPKSVVVARYNAVRVDIDGSVAFNTDEVSIRVILHADSALAIPAGARVLVHA